MATTGGRNYKGVGSKGKGQGAAKRATPRKGASTQILKPKTGKNKGM